jgi:hypothetical protein
MCTSGHALYGLSRGCVSKVDGCMIHVPVWMLPAPTGVWGMAPAATPFARAAGCRLWLVLVEFGVRNNRPYVAPTVVVHPWAL